MRVHVISRERWAAQGVAATLLRGSGVPPIEVTTGQADTPSRNDPSSPDVLVMVQIEAPAAPDLLARWPGDQALLWLGQPVPAFDATAATADRPYGRLPVDVDDARLNAAVNALAQGLSVRDAGAPRRRDAAALPDPTRPLTRVAPRPLPQERLTQRELEVFELLAKGLGNRDIASVLGISAHTAKFHVGQILDKIGAATRTEAVRQGLRLGLVGL